MFNDKIVNHLFYADDAVLLSPSAYGLQQLLYICDEYSKDHNISFNVDKTVCMVIKPSWMIGKNLPTVSLNNTVLKYVSQYKYLGNTYSDNFQDDTDISCKIRDVYSRGNSLISNFKSCSFDLKTTLFKTYCGSIFGCALWTSYKAKSLSSIRVAYNNIFRRFFGFKRDTSISFEMASQGVHHFNILHRMNINSLRNRLLTCINPLVSNIYNALWFSTSRMYGNWYKIIF